MSRLFENQREISLASAKQLIASTLTDLGHDPAGCAQTGGTNLGSWAFRTGSAVTEVQLREASPLPHVRISAPVLRMTSATDRTALYPHLLGQNGQLCGLAFAVAGDTIELVSERSILDLDHSEVRDLIRRIARHASPDLARPARMRRALPAEHPRLRCGARAASKGANGLRPAARPDLWLRSPSTRTGARVAIRSVRS